MSGHRTAGAGRRVSPWRVAALVTTVALTAAVAAPGASAAAPNFGMALRAGTPGLGLDLDLGVSRSLGLRVGYGGLNVSHSLHTSDVDYNGRLKLRTLTALLDWYVFRGGFHLTVGVADNGTRLDVTGRPSLATYTVNGHTYTDSQLGSLAGQAKFRHSVAPYVGLGWGNPVGGNGRVHFLFDIGAIYGGSPVVALTARCGSAAPSGGAVCAAIQNDVAVEQQKLRNKIHSVSWYPVVNLGLAVRF